MLALLAASASALGCSWVLDHGANQCTADADCAQFGGHPYCQSGICVPSGLGPPGCFLGQPAAPSEFAGQCSTAQCLPFDDCARVSDCDGDGGGFAVSLPPADSGSAPPLIAMEAAPTLNCADPSRPNLIYVTGSTDLPPLIRAVQPLLTAGSPSYTVIYLPQTSCAGVASVFDSDPKKRSIGNIPGNWAFFYDSSGNQTLCLLADGGSPVDVGASAVFPASCNYQETPGIADYQGPVQAIAFVVPAASTQQSISAEAAHLVFGAGGDHGLAAPWTDPTLYFVRGAGTGTSQLASRAIEVSPDQWWGLDRTSAANLLASMESVDPTVAEKAIGVLSSEFADSDRVKLRELAFQQHGESCGYLPDSASGAFDKQNVRDGHYPIWGALHLFAPTVNGVPSQAAGALVTRFTVPKLDPTLVGAVISAGFIPSCAMAVLRTTDLGPLASSQPQFGCGCFYAKQVSGSTSCASCAGAGDCPTSAPACNYGYCEIR